MKTPIPRLEVVKDEKIKKELNNRLVCDITQRNYEVFSLSYFTDRGGELEKIFKEQDLVLQYYKPYYLSEYTIPNIFSIINEHKLYYLDGLKLKERNGVNSIKLLHVLDYSVEYEGTMFCLLEGKWASLNQSFLKYIENQIEHVNSFTLINEDYNLTNDKVEIGRGIIADSEEYDDVEYEEYPFNVYLAEEKNLKLLDRITVKGEFPNIEFADLYFPESQSLMHVKIGSTSNLRACIAQSENSLIAFSQNPKIKESIEIGDVKEISMLFVVSTKNMFVDNSIDFNKSKSLNFKIELVNWYKSVINQNYIPKVIVSKNFYTKNEN
ncbi:DUF6119 family protein [Bhargavaea beijingensis]|uniref:Uncharacterized protein n=1 Tax=Bhargavaea beijingensis TaxID=426756 RepID=A0ABX9ZDK4_9BACL|nr:DUF6119 family protein [Bhargavaea beijingensis]RSK33715.1 hypothetical protein EJA12_06105 [Bhargavaea beijingensis]